MTVQEHLPAKTEQRERGRFAGLKARARRAGALVMPSLRVALYQERDLPAESLEARVAQAIERVDDVEDVISRAHKRRPQRRADVSIRPTERPDGQPGRDIIRVNRGANVRLDRHGLYERPSRADVQAHAFAVNPIRPDMDIREFSMTRTTERDAEGQVHDVMRVSTVSRPTAKYHADGTHASHPDNYTMREDIFTLTADADGNFGEPTYQVFTTTHKHGRNDTTHLQDLGPELTPADRLGAMMTTIEGIDLLTPGEGTFPTSQYAYPHNTIAFHNAGQRPA